MADIDLNLLSIAIFVIVLVVIFYRDRKNVRRESVLFLRRTQRGKELIIKLGTAFPRFWKIVGGVGVVTGFIMSIYIFYFLTDLAVKSFTIQTPPALALVLPSPTTEAVVLPGVIGVPFWYWIISIAMLVVVHEGMHGIMFARDRLRIKSLGWGVLAVIPLAFVEQDEKQFTKQKPMIQLRALAAGSFANFLLAGVCFVIIVFVLSGFFIANGVAYRGLAKDYPAQGVNLTGVIIGINSFEVSSNKDLQKALMEVGSNKTITIITINKGQEKRFTILTSEEPEPVFQPGTLTDIIISLDQSIPGTIESSQSLSKSLASLFGVNQERTWRAVQTDIKFWEYAKSKYPALSEKADSKIEQLKLELKSYNRQGFIGIVGVLDSQEIKSELKPFEGSILWIQGLLFFMFLINFGVGAFNLLPLKPLDGGRMWELVCKKISPKNHRILISTLSYITFLLIIVNFVVPFLR